MRAFSLPYRKQVPPGIIEGRGIGNIHQTKKTLKKKYLAIRSLTGSVPVLNRWAWFSLSILSVALLFSACGHDEILTPRPRAYPRVDFPEKTYQTFAPDYCSFTFRYPTYTEVVQDTSFFEDKPSHPCWFDIFYPQFDARLHFTYAPVASQEALNELRAEAFKMVDWQNKKANYIEEIRISKAANNIEGMGFDITGPAASPFQFYLTDNKEHFVRASLYFNTHINPDSLAPMYDFVKMDITEMIDSFEWQ